MSTSLYTNVDIPHGEMGTKTKTVRINEETWKALNSESERTGIPMAQLVQRRVAKFLKGVKA